jgi:ATP-dependent protease HslVU (ClpYQ) ATPase subunit
MADKSPKSDTEKIAALQAHIVGLERKNRTLRMALRQRERRQKHPPRPWGDEKQAEAP